MVKPYTQKFGVTFPVAVDTADVFGQAFGLKAIPVTFLVDEVGIIRLRGGGPNAALLQQIEAVLREPLSKMRGACRNWRAHAPGRNWKEPLPALRTIGERGWLWLGSTMRMAGLQRQFPS